MLGKLPKIIYWYAAITLAFIMFRAIDGYLVCESTNWVACPGQTIDHDDRDEEEE